MVEVSGNSVRKAYLTFAQANELGWQDAPQLFRQIVHTSGGRLDAHKCILTEDEAKRVEAINGQYGHAYCKVLMIKLLSKEGTEKYEHASTVVQQSMDNSVQDTTGT